MRIAVLAIGWILVSSAHGGDGFNFVVIADVGEVAYGSSTERFTVFHKPMINEQGVVAFLGQASATPGVFGPSGIYRWEAGAGAVLARNGMAIPGLPGRTYTSAFGLSAIDGSGRVSFTNAMPFGDDHVSLVASPGDTQIVALSGFAGPPGSNYPDNLGGINQVWQTRSGLLSLGAQAVNGTDVWVGPAGSLVEQLPSSGPFVGAPADGTVRVNGHSLINAQGETMSLGRVVGGVHNSARVVIHGTSSGGEVIVGPGISAGTHGTFTSAGDSPNMNSQGVIGFTANHQVTAGGSDIYGAWAGPSDQFELLAQRGDAAPGLPSGHTFFNLSSPIISSTGSVLLLGSTLGPEPGLLNAMWSASYPGGDLELVCTQGSPVGKTVEGATLGWVDGGFDGEHVAFNANNQFAFMSTINVPGMGTTRGLIAGDTDGALAAIAVIGQQFEVLPGDTRVVKDVMVYHTNSVGPIFGLNGDDGRGTFLNDSGQLVFGLMFTDGTGGLYVAQIPAPSALGFLMLAGANGSRRRRR